MNAGSIKKAREEILKAALSRPQDILKTEAKARIGRFAPSSEGSGTPVTGPVQVYEDVIGNRLKDLLKEAENAESIKKAEG
jgi:hypothetical protein